MPRAERVVYPANLSGNFAVHRLVDGRWKVLATNDADVDASLNVRYWGCYCTAHVRFRG